MNSSRGHHKTVSEVIAVDVMPHPLSLRCEVVAIFGTNANDERCSGRHLNPVLGELCHLFGVVGQQVDLFHPEFPQDFCSYGIVSCIRGVPQHEIGVEGVRSLVLKVIGLNLGVQTNATPFLS